jgi:hypothetical protein
VGLSCPAAAIDDLIVNIPDLRQDSDVDKRTDEFLQVLLTLRTLWNRRDSLR